MMITNFTNAGIYYDRHACYNLDPAEIIAPKSPLFSVQDEEKESIQFEKNLTTLTISKGWWMLLIEGS